MAFKKHEGLRRLGAVAPLAACLMVPMLGMVAFAIDIGYVTVVRNRLQVAADAAAMAAIVKIGDTTVARTAAKNIALKNIAAGPGDYISLQDSDIQFGNWNSTTRTWTANGTPANACRVSAKRMALPLFFAPVIGKSTIDVVADSSTTAAVSAYDIAFVIDLSGSMNNDTEIWATSAINSEFSGYPTIGTDTMQNVFTDFNFGTYPGTTQYVGEGITGTGTYKVNSNGSNATSAYGNISSYLASHPSAVNSSYWVNSSDSSSTKKTKIYSYIIDKQMATLMPNATPALNSSTNLAYWTVYLDYVMPNQGTSIPSKSSYGIDGMSNPYPDAWPSLTSSTISPFYNKVGYQTYVQFMMDMGRDTQVASRYVPLSASASDCPLRYDNDTNSPGNGIHFPPREQPTHSLKLAVMAAVNKIATLNSGLSGDIKDHISIITFDTTSGSSIVYPLSASDCDYAAVKNSLRNLQAVGDTSASTSSEKGLQLALNHLDPAQNSNARSSASKVVIFLTDGIPNVKVSSNTTVDSYVSSHTAEWFNSSGSYYRERNAAMMQVSSMQSKGWQVQSIGIGLGCDRTMMDRMARLAGTAVTDPSNTTGPKISPYATGNPADYQNRLTSIFNDVVKGRSIGLVR